MKKRFIIYAALLMTGCATEPLNTHSARPVPQERILASSFTKPQQGSGTLIVKRDPGFHGAACTHRLYIDGVPFADIDTSEKVQIFLAPGDHILGVKKNGICGGGNAEVSFVLNAGQTRTYRTGVGTSSDITLQPTAF